MDLRDIFAARIAGAGARNALRAWCSEAAAIWIVVAATSVTPRTFPWDKAPRHLIRDRDRIYGSVVTRRLRAMGIRDKPTAPILSPITIGANRKNTEAILSIQEVRFAACN